MTMENDLVERPIHSLTLDSKQPAWEQILGMFARYRAAEPPWRLRDELVCILSWARYGSAAAVRIQALEAELARKTEALVRIERWFGEFPATGTFWDDGSPQSYATLYGSDGERDFIRNIARSALEEKTDV